MAGAVEIDHALFAERAGRLLDALAVRGRARRV
jgi:hypothetical protein